MTNDIIRERADLVAALTCLEGIDGALEVSHFVPKTEYFNEFYSAKIERVSSASTAAFYRDVYLRDNGIHIQLTNGQSPKTASLCIFSTGHLENTRGIWEELHAKYNPVEEVAS